jgi:hypothetical protein
MPWIVDGSDVDAPMKLGKVLGEAEETLEKEENKSVMEEIQELLKRVSFPGEYLTLKPENIADSIRLLTTDAAIPGERYIYIPSSGWSSCLRRDYQVFAAYGSRSFSFFADAGEELPFSRIEEHFKEMVEVGGKRKRANSRLAVIEVSLAAAMTKWQSMLAAGCIRMDMNRRASSVKNHIFTSETMAPIIDSLVAAFKAGKLVTSAKEERIRKAVAAAPTSFSLDEILDSI